MGVIPPELDLKRLTTEEFAALAGGSEPVIVLLPVGAIEPHGPHLPLATDVVISEAAAVRAADLLQTEGFAPLIAPSVPYGVTHCAAAFPGAVSVPAAALTAYLAGVIEGYLGTGATHVCVINNHLEPAHDTAVRASTAGIDRSRATVASPLTHRWARTLSDEFKSGACHAGEYETSIVLSAAPQLVREELLEELPEVMISLSEKLSEGIVDFEEMGLSAAYAGTPARASAAHGSDQLDRLAEMIAAEVVEALQ